MDFWRGPRRQQSLRILLDREAEYSAHIQALGACRGNPADQFRRYSAAATLGPAIEDGLHFRRVPCHDDVGEQAQGVGDGLHLILALGLIVGDAAGVDQALQRIGGFAAIEHAQQLAPEGRIDEIVGEEYRAQQSTDHDADFVQRIAACGGAKARQHIDGAGVTACGCY